MGRKRHGEGPLRKRRGDQAREEKKKKMFKRKIRKEEKEEEREERNRLMMTESGREDEPDLQVESQQACRWVVTYE